MVPQQRHHGAALGKGDHLHRHAPAVRPPVDVVAQENQGVERRGGDGPDQGSQRRRANVANRYRASFGHAVFVSLVLRNFADGPAAGRAVYVLMPGSRRFS
jgi:hypothetical protein